MAVKSKFDNKQLDHFVGHRLCFEGIGTGNAGRTCGQLGVADISVKAYLEPT